MLTHELIVNVVAKTATKCPLTKALYVDLYADGKQTSHNVTITK